VFALLINHAFLLNYVAFVANINLNTCFSFSNIILHIIYELAYDASFLGIQMKWYLCTKERFQESTSSGRRFRSK
jgi:hypothetical protein